MLFRTYIATSLSFFALLGSLGAQQTYDLLIQGGHIIDPSNNIDRVMDVAVVGNRIARVAENIPPQQAKKRVDAKGMYVTPGLIDIHMHVYIRARRNTLLPDDTALVSGVTTVVDAGTSGWRNFEDFKTTIIDRSVTRVLAFINILGQGMKDNSEGESNEEDMNPVPVAAKIKEHPDIIVGIKNAHYEKPGWIALKRTVEAGNLANKPIMVDDDVFSDSGRTTREKVLEVMRPGDIHTHMYNDHQLELVDRKTGVVQPYMWEARRRGVLFDLGHGGGSFIWPVATKAVKQGFLPDTFGTDLHPPSRISGQVDVPNCISKLMSLGMSLQDGILRATVNPAKAIRHFPELGTLGVGKTADISIFELKTGAFSYTDSARKKLAGTKKLQCVLTVRDGRVVYDRDGISFPLWTSAGEYEVLR